MGCVLGKTLFEIGLLCKRQRHFQHNAGHRYFDRLQPIQRFYIHYGRVAQLDRVSASEAEGHGFESHLVHQLD